MQSADDLVMCLGDLNGHVGRPIDGFYGVRGGYDEGHLMGFMEGMVKVI